MKDSLLQKSSMWAQTAIRSYTDRDFESFFVQAGISFELLGKGFLAGFHPSLIIDKDFDSLLQVGGGVAHSKRPPGDIKTIGARDVVARISQIIPLIEAHRKGLERLADLRNGVVDLGSATDAIIPDIMNAYLKGTSLILKECAIDVNSHFGNFASFVQTFVDEKREEVEKTVAGEIAKCREAFHKRYDNKEPAFVNQLKDLCQKSYNYNKYHTIPWECPACSSIAMASGVGVTSWELDDPEDVTPNLVLTLHFMFFECKMCDLLLDGEEEIKVAGVPLQQNVENPTLSELEDLE